MCTRTAFHVRAAALIAALWLAGAARARDDAQMLARLNESALAAYRVNDLRRARAELRTAIRAARRSRQHGPAVARCYLNSGVVLSASGQHRAAVRAFRHALEEQAQLALPAELASEAARSAYREAYQRVHGAVPPEPQRRSDDAQPLPAAAPHARDAARELHRLESRLASRSALAQAAPEQPPALSPPPRTTSPAHDEHGRAHPPWFLEVGVGLGFSALRPGQTPDRHPSESTLDEVVRAVREERDGRLRASDVESELREHGWECDAATRGNEVSAENCVLATDRGISVLDPILDMALGYHALPRFALALSALVQRHAGHGPMAGIVLGVRGEYMLTPPADEGVQLGAIAGVGIGSLRARGRGTSEEAPAATHARDHRVGSVFSFGAKAAYRSNRHLAFALTPLFNVGLPKVLYDIGLTGGVEVAF